MNYIFDEQERVVVLDISASDLGALNFLWKSTHCQEQPKVGALCRLCSSAFLMDCTLCPVPFYCCCIMYRCPTHSGRP